MYLHHIYPWGDHSTPADETPKTHNFAGMCVRLGYGVSCLPVLMFDPAPCNCQGVGSTASVSEAGAGNTLAL